MWNMTMGVMEFHNRTSITSFITFHFFCRSMDKELLPLEDRIRNLEKEVERLRRLLESHVRDHGITPPVHPDRPFKPGHPDVGPPKEI